MLPVQNMLEGATIRTQATSDPATNRDSNELVGSHVEEMMLDTTTQMDARSSGVFSGFVKLDDVSTEYKNLSYAITPMWTENNFPAQGCPISAQLSRFGSPLGQYEISTKAEHNG